MPRRLKPAFSDTANGILVYWMCMLFFGITSSCSVQFSSVHVFAISAHSSPTKTLFKDKARPFPALHCIAFMAPGLQGKGARVRGSIRGRRAKLPSPSRWWTCMPMTKERGRGTRCLPLWIQTTTWTTPGQLLLPLLGPRKSKQLYCTVPHGVVWFVWCGVVWCGVATCQNTIPSS